LDDITNVKRDSRGAIETVTRSARCWNVKQDLLETARTKSHTQEWLSENVDFPLGNYITMTSYDVLVYALTGTHIMQSCVYFPSGFC